MSSIDKALLEIQRDSIVHELKAFWNAMSKQRKDRLVSDLCSLNSVFYVVPVFQDSKRVPGGGF